MSRGLKKVLTGKVISSKMDKTLVVAVERSVQHPVYKKIVKKTKKFIAHDKNNEASPGDVVKIIKTRPLSKTKRWAVLSIEEKAK